MSAAARAWALPTAFGVLSYGLAAVVWKGTAIDVGRFCVLFVAGKAAVNAGLWALRGRPSLTDPRSRPFLAASLAAAMINGIAWIAYLVAFERGPLCAVQTLTATYTAVAVVLAVVFLRERLARAQALGVALVVAAGVALASAGEASSAGARGGWLPACLVAAVAWGAATVVARRAFDLPGADDARFFICQGLGLAVTVLPYGLACAPAAGSSLGALVVAALYVVADLAIYTGVARGPASVVTPMSGLYPIPAIVYAALVLGERPGAVGWAGIALALPGIVLAVPSSAAPARTKADPA